MIRSFKNQLAEDLFFDRQSSVTRRFPSALRRASQRKLQYLNSASRIADLASPPGNRLEALKGKFTGLYSIRINDQWRIVFSWNEGPHEVQIIDYH